MFSEEAKYNIVNYKYHGGDNSPLYQHVLSPLAQWCVDTVVPSWMAPNVITALGLACSFSAVVLTLIFNPSLGPNAPRWLHLHTACAIFLYQTLDNMDGKQARKTGSSSALGMLFDHGCDAINAGISVVSMSSVMGLGWSNRLFFSYFSTFILFYFQTWEEYYTGTMALPAFNGPTEGLAMAYTIGIISFFCGSEIHHTPLFDIPSFLLFPENAFLEAMDFPSVKNPHFTPFNIMVVIVFVAAIITPIAQIYRVIKALWRSKPEATARALLNLSPFLVYFPCLFYYNMHSTIAMPKHPLLTALFHASTFAELVIHIMVGHISKTRIMSIERYSVWFFAVVVLVSYYEQGEGPYELSLLLTVTIYSTISCISYFHLVCSEFADVLNIFVFKMGKKDPSRKVVKDE